MSVLKDVCSIHGTLGIDVGGTLAKCVMAEPHAASTWPAEFDLKLGRIWDLKLGRRCRFRPVEYSAFALAEAHALQQV